MRGLLTTHTRKTPSKQKISFCSMILIWLDVIWQLTADRWHQYEKIGVLSQKVYVFALHGSLHCWETEQEKGRTHLLSLHMQNVDRGQLRCVRNCTPNSLHFLKGDLSFVWIPIELSAMVPGIVYVFMGLASVIGYEWLSLLIMGGPTGAMTTVGR